ncbi:hypothetical protein [Mesorhizobium sp. M0030]|uniref:hypothetical protein n=1 Tax=Mesorhizobium sp. M0030 TaxID=2956851 RepID=UPI00333BF9EC
MNLRKRASDGPYISPNCELAIVMKARSGVEDGNTWLEFKIGFNADLDRLDWPTAAGYVVATSKLRT